MTTQRIKELLKELKIVIPYVDFYGQVPTLTKNNTKEFITYCKIKAELKGMLYQMKEEVEIIEKLTPQLFHNIYEEQAIKSGWDTQNNCKVEFDDLPETNQETMIYTIEKIKKLLGLPELNSNIKQIEDNLG